jgi:hypothetical protein
MLWKESNPTDARVFLEESNRSVLAFVRARSGEEAALHLRACRELGVNLGRAIGVSAEINAPQGADAAWCKALGAGNELGACLVPAGSTAPPEGKEIQRVRASKKGILWGG